LTNKVESVII